MLSSASRSSASTEKLMECLIRMPTPRLLECELWKNLYEQCGLVLKEFISSVALDVTVWLQSLMSDISIMSDLRLVTPYTLSR
jgi:hypothetical protein